MYTKYFGFNEKPFTLTPNPRFIFLSNNHKDAFAHLLYGINNHYGFIELIGEVGTGKTTVLRTLLNKLHEDNYRTALIVNPCLSGVELLRSVCHEYGLNAKSEYVNELLMELNDFLLSETSQGRTVVLVIDESQNLQPAVLEQVRLISNLETENDKLIQIILAGQPELGTLLERPELRQLNQRIAVRYRLNSLNMYETRAYIRHRMEVAGETGGVSFTLFATRLIYLYSRGIPRMINIICDRSLLIGYGNERRSITAGVVIKGIRELLIPRNKRLSMAFTCLLCIAFISIALNVNLSGWMSGKLDKGANHKVPSAVADAASPQTADQQLLRLQQEILSYDQNEVHILAFNAIADEWGANPIKELSGQLTVPKKYSYLAERRYLKITEFNGTLDDVIRFDLPFLVLTKAAGGLGGYCIAVTSSRDDMLSISPPLFGSNTISKNDLSTISTGTFYLEWKNSGRLPSKFEQGDKRFEIRVLQQLLMQAGTYKDAIDGTYSIATVKAVSDFQHSAGIPRDESVGELTLAALTKYYTNQKVPSISSAGRIK